MAVSTNTKGAITNANNKPQAVRQKENTPLQTMNHYIKMYKNEIAKALPSVLTPERFSRMATTAITKTPKLAECTVPSFIGALLLSSCLGLSAKSVKAPSGGKVISDNLIGIFFEDISFSADGGLYADLVQNGSFEYSPAQRDGWGPGTNWKFLRPGHSAGFIEPRMDNTIHPNNPTYMRIYAERIGHYYDFDGWTGVGMKNEGFFGMNIKSGAKYNFSVFFRSVEGNARNILLSLQPMTIARRQISRFSFSTRVIST